jgi:hypothetical protein
MLNNKTYIKTLSFILVILFGGALLYTYFYSKKYPIPLTSRISLDAKIMFIRDMPNRDNIDTIVMGSSIGLNNVNGSILEKESKNIQHVLNLSAFSMEVSHNAQLIELFSLFPNLKRVIYSAQSLDFTGETPFDEVDIDLLKEYIVLGKKNTNFKFTFLAYKNFINIIKRRYVWGKDYLAHNHFHNLDYDHTGSAGLHIYGKDIIHKRWINPYAAPTNKESYEALNLMIKALRDKNIKFYFFIQPYRQELIDNDPKLEKIFNDFNDNAQKVILENDGYFLSLLRKLHLKDKYFADRMHLNDQGNIIASKTIGKFIDDHEK